MGRQGDVAEPKGFDRLNHFLESGKVGGFSDVTIGVQAVGVGDVLFGAGGSQHDDGNGFEFGVGFDFGEQFPAIFAGHVEIEQDDIGAGGGVEGAFAAEEFHRLDAVVDDMDAAGLAGLFQSFAG